MAKIPLISILVCNYNYSKLISDTLDSALQQTYKNTEVIIIDDGSKDNSVQVVKQYIDSHKNSGVRLKEMKPNKGICYARNEALELATGEFFIFLDSDDTLPEDYLEKMYTVATAKNADVVYGDMKIFGDETGTVTFPDYNQHELLLRNYINATSLVRRDKIGGHRFDIKLNRRTLEDYDFWLGLSLKGLTFVKAKNTYLNYRIQHQSRNNNTLTQLDKIIAFINVWYYAIEKYRKQYPAIITDEIYFQEMQYQLIQMKTVEDELMRLNKVVQSELNPELEKRKMHIDHQQRIIDHHLYSIEEYRIRVENLEAQLHETLNSKDYRTGQWLINKGRKIKKVIRK